MVLIPYTNEDPKIKGVSVYDTSWRYFMAGESSLRFTSALSHLEALLHEGLDGKPRHREVTEYPFLKACQWSRVARVETGATPRSHHPPSPQRIMRKPLTQDSD